MKSKYLFFLNVLSSLDHAGVLPHLMLIGSWCLYAYRQYFDNAPEIPLLRTADIDFLIPRPFKMENKKIDAHKILLNLGFDEQFSLLNGTYKICAPAIRGGVFNTGIGQGKQQTVYRAPIEPACSEITLFNFVTGLSDAFEFRIN